MRPFAHFPATISHSSSPTLVQVCSSPSVERAYRPHDCSHTQKPNLLLCTRADSLNICCCSADIIVTCVLRVHDLWPYHGATQADSIVKASSASTCADGGVAGIDAGPLGSPRCPGACQHLQHLLNLLRLPQRLHMYACSRSAL